MRCSLQLAIALALASLSFTSDVNACGRRRCRPKVCYSVTYQSRGYYLNQTQIQMSYGSSGNIAAGVLPNAQYHFQDDV